MVRISFLPWAFLAVSSIVGAAPGSSSSSVKQLIPTGPRPYGKSTTTKTSTAKVSVTPGTSTVKVPATPKTSTAKTPVTIKTSTAKSSLTTKSGSSTTAKCSTANSSIPPKSGTAISSKAPVTTAPTIALTTSLKTTSTPSPTSNSLCPGYPVTKTTTLTTTEYYGTTPPGGVRTTGTLTSTFYSLTTTITTYTVTITSVADPVYTSTFTATLATYTSVVVSPPIATVTVPTAPGFTPLACEPAYIDPTTIVTISSAIEYGTYTEITVTSEGLSSTYDIIYVTTTSTRTVYSWYGYTPTVTSTRTNPTSTVYEACASNNVVSRAPGPGDKGLFVGAPPLGIDYWAEVGVPSLNEVDCCELCQANSSCVASAYYIVGNENGPYPRCNLYIKDATTNQTCDPTFKGPLAAITDEPSSALSNGGCGQFYFSYVY